ncbi:nucleotidyltransferase family protein, partial [Thioclava sp. BHET1]
MLIPILIPAAGAARRMRGADKLLEPVGGTPLLRRQAQLALATGQPVLVTLPVPEGARGAALAGLDLTRLPVPDAAEGMAASLRTRIAARPAGAAGVLILLADMPEIEVEDLRHLLETFAADPDAPI